METAQANATTDAKTSSAFHLKKILLAYDASKAAEEALEGATELARRFGAEILVARILSPEDVPLDDRGQSRHEKDFAEGQLEEIRGRLAAEGLRCRGIVRIGSVSDTIVNLCAEEGVDLVMLGAYGYGVQDRRTLGSTAEHLLSTMPCPAMVFGPSVKASRLRERDGRPILFPVMLPLSGGQVERAIRIAQLFQSAVEVLHVRSFEEEETFQQREKECGEIASLFAAAGVQSTYSVVPGDPWQVIVRRSTELASPFVLIPVRYHHVMTADRAAAHTIRASEAPVLTYSAH